MRAMILLVALMALGGCETPKNCDATRPVVEWINAPEYVAEGELVTMRAVVSSAEEDEDLTVAIDGRRAADISAEGEWSMRIHVLFGDDNERTFTWRATAPDGCSSSASHTFRLTPTT